MGAGCRSRDRWATTVGGGLSTEKSYIKLAGKRPGNTEFQIVELRPQNLRNRRVIHNSG
jgi:hypothetical protein